MATYFRPLRVSGPLSVTVPLTGLATSPCNRFIYPKRPLLICTGILVGAIGLLADLIVAQRRRN